MKKRSLSLLAALAVAGLPSVALAQPVGPEFQVNTYTTGSQNVPPSRRMLAAISSWSGIA